MESTSLKRFLEKNTDYKEIKPNQESATIGGFQKIDEIEDEVYILQCPKGFDVETELQGQKLKLPGRTNYNTAETVAVEYTEPEIKAFGYCNRKGRYSLRLLPIKGNILLRGRLKAAEAITLENAQALYPPEQRILMPDMIKVRHPLHGHQFDRSIRVDKAIAERLKKADEISAKVLLEAITSKKKVKTSNSGMSKTRQISKKSAAENNDNDVIFVSEAKEKKHKNKRTYAESSVVVQGREVHMVNDTVSRKKKLHKHSIGEEVAKDLQWIKNL